LPPYGSTLAKLAALVGGAVVGLFLARKMDELIVKQAQTRSETDQTRYERGLPPISPHQDSEEDQRKI
jgi:hypothetical protein